MQTRCEGGRCTNQATDFFGVSLLIGKKVRPMGTNEEHASESTVPVQICLLCSRCTVLIMYPGGRDSITPPRNMVSAKLDQKWSAVVRGHPEVTPKDWAPLASQGRLVGFSVRTGMMMSKVSI